MYKGVFSYTSVSENNRKLTLRYSLLCNNNLHGLFLINNENINNLLPPENYTLYDLLMRIIM